MAFRDAVQQLADKMLGDTDSIIRGFGEMLQMLLKASEGEERPHGHVLPSPGPDNDRWLQKRDIREMERESQLEEETTPRMAVCMNGPLAGEYFAISPQMPEGAKMSCGRETYQLVDGSLRLCEDLR